MASDAAFSKHASPAGEMAARVRAYDWAKTAIGPASGWSPTLRIVVDVVLASAFPMALRWGPDFILIYNDGYKSILGDRHPAALGLPFREASPEVQYQLAPLHEDILAGRSQGQFSADFPLVIRRYRDRWEEARFTIAYSPIPDATAPTGVGGVLITAVETTERTRIERALRASEERFELALEAAGGIGTWDWDIRMNVATADARFANLFSMDAAKAAAGAPLEDFIVAIHPDDRAHVIKRFRACVQTEEDFCEEYRLMQRDGSVRWVVARGRCARDSEGQAQRFPGVVVDITERKRAEEALAELNQTLETRIAERTSERDRVWRITHNLIGVSTFRGTLLSVNPSWQRLLGWSARELLVQNYFDLCHPDDLESSEAEHEEMRRGITMRDFVNRLRHKDGSYRWISWTGVPDEGVAYLVGRDITFEKQTAESLRQAEDTIRQAQKMEAVGQLTGGLAHDFNNILTGVIGSLEMIQTRIGQGRFNDVERYAKAATTSAHRAAALTHRLLAFARRQPLDPKPININQLIGSMEDLLRRTTGETLQVEIVSADGVWPTFCDPNQLENVLLNLVINARDAMPDGGRLTIATANDVLDEAYAVGAPDIEAGPYVCLSVTDTGAGMTPEVVARAFDPFFTTKPQGQGTGLGLSMVYGFAKQSSGHVRIHSQVGEGTTVKLYLPRYRGAIAEQGLDAMPANDSRGAGETVLVIEDDPIVRELVIDVLNELGYRALEAADGPSGLSILQSDARIDLLVSDVGLPGMNGRQVAGAARRGRPELKVLFITGYAENATIGGGFLDAGMEMMTKPFAVEALARRIRDMIES